MHYLKKLIWFKLPKIADPNTVGVFTKYLFCIRPRSQHRQVIRNCVYTVDIVHNFFAIFPFGILFPSENCLHYDGEKFVAEIDSRRISARGWGGDGEKKLSPCSAHLRASAV